MQQIIGIDPGVNTGFARIDGGELVECRSLLLHEAFERVRAAHLSGDLRLVVFEDARLRKWYGNKGREALQGAGSAKRDAKAWADFLSSLGCAFKAVKPQAGATKWSASYFERVTGWKGRTNEHGRDAACLILGMR